MSGKHDWQTVADWNWLQGPNMWLCVCVCNSPDGCTVVIDTTKRDLLPESNIGFEINFPQVTNMTIHYTAMVSTMRMGLLDSQLWLSGI